MFPPEMNGQNQTEAVTMPTTTDNGAKLMEKEAILSSSQVGFVIVGIAMGLVVLLICIAIIHYIKKALNKKSEAKLPRHIKELHVHMNKNPSSAATLATLQKVAMTTRDTFPTGNLPDNFSKMKQFYADLERANGGRSDSFDAAATDSGRASAAGSYASKDNRLTISSASGSNEGSLIYTTTGSVSSIATLRRVPGAEAAKRKAKYADVRTTVLSGEDMVSRDSSELSVIDRDGSIRSLKSPSPPPLSYAFPPLPGIPLPPIPTGDEPESPPAVGPPLPPKSWDLDSS